MIALSCTADNGLLYSSHGLNFVMGTTGGDREKLILDVKNSGTYAVIAPQMGKQVLWIKQTIVNLCEDITDHLLG